METGNVIVDKSFEFAVSIVKFTDQLYTKNKIIAQQLMKSGTSIGANIREAQNASSKADFIQKMKIAAREIEETEYWLSLCQSVYELPENKKLFEKVEELHKIINKIIATAKTKYTVK